MLEKILEIKKQLKISYYNLALEIGIAETTLYRFCKGAKITPEKLIKIQEYTERW